jgi:hypothetical protein
MKRLKFREAIIGKVRDILDNDLKIQYLFDNILQYKREF